MPLVTIGVVIAAGLALTGATNFALAILIVGATLATFSVGHVAMGRRITNAGSIYAHIAQGLGRIIGAAAAGVAVLTYGFLQFALYGLFGVVAADLLGVTGIGEVSGVWWLFALCGWALVGLLGTTRVDLSTYTLGCIIIGQVIFLLLVDGALIASGELAAPQGGYPPSPDLLKPGIGVVLLIAVVAFAGFETPLVFGEESRNYKRTINLSTFSTLGLLTGLYVLTSWTFSAATHPAELAGHGNTLGFDLMISLASSHLGTAAAGIGRVVLLVSVFAAMTSFHNTSARYMFGLAREGFIPRSLARTGDRTGAPTAASLFQTAAGLCVIIVAASAGVDPIGGLFLVGLIAGGFGLVVLSATTSIATLCAFARARRGESWWTAYAAPAVSAFALGWIGLQAAGSFDELAALGLPQSVERILLGPFAFAAALGGLRGLILRHFQPAVYEGFGRGGLAVRSSVAPIPSSHVAETDRALR
ncbi:APC family permease [Catellatospora paridis]|uniref:APC family permease n=1 Tax=Catellatospora paridis TaxID=1617086 RepID=UPI0012D43490|nr:APC family permease [Catellatospora paridis]